MRPLQGEEQCYILIIYYITHFPGDRRNGKLLRIVDELCYI